MYQVDKLVEFECGSKQIAIQDTFKYSASYRKGLLGFATYYM